MDELYRGVQLGGMGLNCMETYIRLYGFLPVWFEWKGNSRLERIGEVEMGWG